MILNEPPDSQYFKQILYKTPQGESASVYTNAQGLPLLGITNTATFNFTPIDSKKIEVQITLEDQPLPSAVVALPADAAALVSSNSKSASLKTSSNTAKNGQETPAEVDLLRRAVIAVRTFGCSGSAAANQIGIEPGALPTTNRSCQSVLLDVIHDTVERNTFDNVSISELDSHSSCESASGSTSLAAAESCLSETGGVLVDQILTKTPDLETAVTGELPSGEPVIDLETLDRDGDGIPDLEDIDDDGDGIDDIDDEDFIDNDGDGISDLDEGSKDPDTLNPDDGSSDGDTGNNNGYPPTTSTIQDTSTIATTTIEPTSTISGTTTSTVPSTTTSVRPITTTTIPSPGTTTIVPPSDDTFTPNPTEPPPV